MASVRYRQFFTCTVTLANASQVYRLWDLIQALLNVAPRVSDPASAGDMPGEVRLSSGADLNTSGKVYIGDLNLSTTQRWKVLNPGDDEKLGPAAKVGFPLVELYVMGSVANMTLDVMILQ